MSSSSLVRPPLFQHRATAPITGGASFAVMAGLVAYGDLITKWLAVALWSGEQYPLVGRAIGIEVVHNPLSAFSISLGPLTREINIAATVIAVLLSMAVSSRLARLDRGAPESLGLIAGAGIGNLVSMLGSTSGVPDFLALGNGSGSILVLNFADVAAYIGIACCLRLAWIVVRTAAAPRAAGERRSGPDDSGHATPSGTAIALRWPRRTTAARRSLAKGES